MYKPSYTPINYTTNGVLETRLPPCFTVLTWNLQKTDFSHYVQRPIRDLFRGLNHDITPHILSLQEAKTKPEQNTFFNLPYIMAPNIQTQKHHFGVVTASSSIITPTRQFLTQSREFGWTTHKTALITQHLLSNNQTLTHVNIHAINFVTNTTFYRELNKVWQYLEHVSGPIILSGDFNTWNAKRALNLMNAVDKLHLKTVAFPDHKPIKTMLRHPIDFIFYRDLILKESEAIPIKTISDHNPILATFCTR